MPRTVYGAAARAAEAVRKQEEATKKHAEKVAAIIRTAALQQGLRTDTKISEAVGVEYRALYNALHGSTEWKLGNLLKVCDGLGLSNEARAAILGGGT